MARIGEMIGWGENPLYKTLGANRNALIGFGAGLASDGWGGAAQGIANGAARDDTFALLEQEKATEAAQNNKTAEWLQSQGYTDLLPLVEAGQGGLALGEAFKRMQPGYGQSGIDPTANMQDVDYLVGQGVDRDTAIAQVFGPVGGAGGQLGNTVYTGRDANGNIVPMQVGPQGFVPSALPDGVVFDPGALNAERAAGTKYGAGVGQGALDLPGVEANADFAVRNLQGLLYQTDAQGNTITENGQPVPNYGLKEQFSRGLFNAPTGQYLPAINGTEKANFQTRLTQVQGQSFLQALEFLKGSGAVSEVEGAKATSAINRASTAQTEDEFTKAVNEAITIIERGRENAQRLAGETQFTGGPPAASSGGRTTSGGVTYSVDQ